MADCLFCKIIAGQIPATIVYQSDHVVAFKDITPRAPTHVLIVPRRHIASLNDLGEEDDALVGEMVRTAATARCSTAMRMQARPSSTSTCTCLAAGR